MYSTDSGAAHTQIAELMRESGVTFGTSGARGTVEAMTDEVCHAYTCAFLAHMRETGLLPTGGRVAVAGDLRASTPRIMRSVFCAISAQGYQGINCGFIPSPALALYGLSNAMPSIMVTGSHIPEDRNGIKFNRPDGEILKPDEEAIRSQWVNYPPPPGDLAAESPAVDDTAVQQYKARYTEFFGPRCLSGMRIGVYEHSGVARDLLGDVLGELGAEVVSLNRADTFIPVDTEAIRPEDVELAASWAAPGGFDAIVSTDGDADRPLIATEKGEWLRGDIAGILCAAHLGVRNVVTPVSSNTAAERSGLFEVVRRTRIGSPFVIEGMHSLLGQGAARVGGYEANGGFLLGSPVTRNGRTLTPLPTRDAVIVILSVLLEAKSAAKAVSGLLSALPSRYTASNRIKEFPTDQSSRIVTALTGGSGPRPAPRAEAVFGPICGDVAAVDVTDGMRITFANGEIVHLRPSGNAPELRCYNEADSPERVAELNEACMAILAAWKQRPPEFTQGDSATPDV